MSRRRGRAHHHERPRHTGPAQGARPSQPRSLRAEPDLAGPTGAPVMPPSMIGSAAVTPPTLPATLPPSPSAQPPVAAAPVTAAPAAPVPSAPPPGGPMPARRDGPVVVGQAQDRLPIAPDRGSPCTAPQLRRFIKSRPYVPMHELRRRFAIEGTDDDVCPIALEPGRVYVGLPDREGQLLGELLRAGEIGYELSLDPRTPVVIGVYPMRPVPRA